MTKPPLILDLPEIPAAERTPLVEALLAILGHQQEIIVRQDEELKTQKDEIRKLKRYHR